MGWFFLVFDRDIILAYRLCFFFFVVFGGCLEKLFFGKRKVLVVYYVFLGIVY